ncbi:MAG: nitroreductase family protein [Candidatus Bathyarchaeota archaeon]|nr:MAG: nitroreductase family protein [Candidatus Bathyarchaeota archaeon]
MSILGLFRNRRSVKDYSSSEVSNKVLFEILEATRWAPSAHNAQPWRFVVIRDPDLKRELAKAMASRWDKDMSKNGVPLENRQSFVKISVKRFTNAPVLIVACLTMEDMDEYLDKRRQKIEYILAVQSVAAAIENLLLAAHAEGLGSCWFCAPLFCQDVVRQVLKVPHNVEPQALITLGHSDELLEPLPRKALQEIVYQDRWGDVV